MLNSSSPDPDPFSSAPAPSRASTLLAPHGAPAPHAGAEHAELAEGEFWQRFPAYRHVDAATFLDARWQQQHSVRTIDELSVPPGAQAEAFLNDLRAGLERAPMALRVTPYMLSLIDWERPASDPIRRQFLPLGSEKLANHPLAGLDSLGERASSPVPRLTHRYPDRALLIATDICPVYCRYCTRSYSVGVDTGSVAKRKLRIGGQPSRWSRALDYVREHAAIEDVVVSGGDVFMLKAREVAELGQALLDIPHLRRMRFATKGLGVMPMKLLSDGAWLDALTGAATRGRKLGKEVSVHTHIAHPNEITWITQAAARALWDRGITVRNQCVLLRGVNDDADTLRLLIRRLAYLNVHPYYVFQHDFVPGVEELRTALHATLALEKAVRGVTAGYNMPTFVVDLMGGGGKRDAHSYESYDRMTGIGTYRSPVVDPTGLYFHFDPIDTLPREGQRRWSNAAEIPLMLAEARRDAGA